jgi:hypothetical protein
MSVVPDAAPGVRPGEPGYLEGRGRLVITQIGCCPCGGGWPVLESATRDRAAETIFETECKDCYFKARLIACLPVYCCGREEKLWVPTALATDMRGSPGVDAAVPPEAADAAAAPPEKPFVVMSK